MRGSQISASLDIPSLKGVSEPQESMKSGQSHPIKNCIFRFKQYDIIILNTSDVVANASDLCIHAELTSMDSTDESTPTQL